MFKLVKVKTIICFRNSLNNHQIGKQVSWGHFYFIKCIFHISTHFFGNLFIVSSTSVTINSVYYANFSKHCSPAQPMV